MSADERTAFYARKSEVARIGGNLMDLIGSHPLEPLAYVRMLLADHRALLADAGPSTSDTEQTRLWWIRHIVSKLENIERFIVAEHATIAGQLEYAQAMRDAAEGKSRR